MVATVQITFKNKANIMVKNLSVRGWLMALLLAFAQPGLAQDGTATEQDKQKYQQMFTQAMQAVNQSALENANAMWQQLLNQFPNDLAVMNNFAVTLMKQGKYIEAQQVLEEALNSDAKVALLQKNLNAIYSYEAKLAYQNVFQEAKVSAPVGDWFSLQSVSVEAPKINEVKQVSNDIQVVLNQVENWRAAWADKNVSKYTRYYLMGYQPDSKTSHASWLYARKRSLERPKFIEIALTNVEAVLLADNKIQVSFFQKYRSNLFNDRIKKILVWEKEGSEWKISLERIVHG